MCARCTPNFLTELELSIVGDLGIARLGGIINWESCKLGSVIPFLCLPHTPIYMCWEHVDNVPWCTNGWLLDKKHVPGTSVIKDLQATTPFIHIPVTEQEIFQFPAIEAFSNQRPSERWQEFFSCQLGQNEEAELQETEIQRCARQQCALHAQNHVVPGRNGATVFYWENIDGFRIR